MKSLNTWILLIWIVALTLGIATLVIYLTDLSYCENMPIPEYSDAITRFSNFTFHDKFSRYAVEPIAHHKINTMTHKNMAVDLMKVSTMTDYAVYLIVTTDILNLNAISLEIYNHVDFTKVVSDYDSSIQGFKSPSSKQLGIGILLIGTKYEEPKRILGEKLSTQTDKFIYDSLISATRSFTI